MAKEISCWKVMGCGKKGVCPATLDSSRPCWEVARALNDYRSAMNVCADCLVYMMHQENLSGAELDRIMERRGLTRNACLLSD